MIPDEVVQQVREAADIVSLIGEYVTLKRTGTDWRGPCPFHQGTHRNFSVSPRKGIYYCFVCHEGGDVFAFMQKRLGLSWPEAVRHVASKSGIEVREVNQRREGPDPREPVWEVNAAAAEFFQRFLWTEDSAAPAREYLATRALDRSVAERYGLGFAPREIGMLRAYLASLGYSDALMLESGVLVRGEDDSEPRPRFRGRLIFPILDVSGRHAGFGGRVIGQGEPKYLNSPESPVFSKGKLLYGLNWAKNEIRRSEHVLVVEGYFDAVRIAAAGMQEVVAPLGTALTPDQAALIRRYSKTAYLLYDSDKAGQRATFRSADALLAHGVSVLVVTFPEGDDPDSFVRKNGLPALQERLKTATDVMELKIQLLERGGWFANLRRKRLAVDRLLPTLRATVDEVTREMYLARMASAAGVTADVLRRELSGERGRDGTGAGHGRPEYGRGGWPDRGYDGREHVDARDGGRVARTEAGPGMRGVQRREDRRDKQLARGSSAERELLRVMLVSPAHVDIVAERDVATESFRNPVYRELFTALLEMAHEQPAESAKLAEAVAQRVGPEAADLARELAAESGAIIDVDRTVEGCLAGLRRRDVQERLDTVDREMTLATAEQKDDLIREKQRLVLELRDLGGTGRYFGKSRS